MDSGQSNRTKLDDPDVKLRLRYVRRSSTYIHRPSNYSSQLITDVKASQSKGINAALVKSAAPTDTTKVKPTAVSPQRVDIMSRPSASAVHGSRTRPADNFSGQHDQDNHAARSVIEPRLVASATETSDKSVETHKHDSKPSVQLKKRSDKDTPSSEPTQTLLKRVGNLVKPSSWQQAALYSAAVVLLVVGGYVSFSGWRANQQVEAQASHLQKIANANVGSGSTDSDNSKKPVVPSTKPVSKHTIADYHVASNLPRYIKIPKINVFARVLQVGVNSDGHLGVPPNIYDTAWYTGSAEPGGAGATLIDGHLDGYNAIGVFWNLHKLTKGDKIQIERGDGKTFTYKVVKTKSYKTGNIPMSSALEPIVPGKPGLNLITCSGDVSASTDWHYTERLIVYATQV